MKTTFLIIAIIGCIALGILGVEQSKKLEVQGEQLKATQQQVAALESELKEKETAIDNAKSIEAKSKLLQKTLSDSTTAAIAESKKTEKLQEALEQAKTNNPLHAVASMFKDPDMREMIKSQQKVALGPVIKKEYSDLFKQLNLTPEQSAAFSDLVMKKMMGNTDAGLSMLDGNLDASQRADLAKQVKEQSDAVDAEIKQFLGDNNFQTYQSYEKTLADRMTMSQFNDQLAGTPTELSPAQQTQLIQALTEARSSFNWSSGLSQQDAGANGDIAGMLTQENIAKYVAEHEQFDQQFLTRAQTFLTPDQLAAFQKYQKSQRDLQVMSMKMAGQMLGK